MNFMFANGMVTVWSVHIMTNARGRLFNMDENGRGYTEHVKVGELRHMLDKIIKMKEDKEDCVQLEMNVIRFITDLNKFLSSSI